MTDYIPDKIEILPDGSIIQHGSFNNRIYLIKTVENVSPELATELIELAEEKKYTKIFAKVPAKIAKDFFGTGFVEEGKIPGLYNNKEDVLFMGYFLDPKRKKENSQEEIEKVISLARKKASSKAESVSLPENTVLRQCTKNDTERMSDIYKRVYKSYPFPIDNPAYIAETMKAYFDYFCIEIENKIVALSSFELFEKSKSVEMTDFATLPEFRGRGFAGMLLREMESQAMKKGFKTAFTVARAVSPGMNITFAKNGYTCGGRLKNNTNISGRIESMNIWYKKI